MKRCRGWIALTAMLALLTTVPQQSYAGCCGAGGGGCNYVTDTGGAAYDECRAATNLGAAIALGTVAIVGIVALGVQNSHGSTTTHAHFSSSSSSSSSD